MTRLYWPTLALIDLDGTLVDSVPDMCVAANLMLADLGFEPVSRERLQGYVGNGIERLIHRCLTGQLDGIAATRSFTAARKLLFGYYAIHNGRHSHLYPGVREGLEQLREHAIILCCVTNKGARFSEQLLEHFGIRECFSLLVAGDTLAHRKPHPAPLLHAAHTLKVPLTNCLMIGDSIHDVAAARAAGMPVVAVSYGYNHGRDIRDADADAVIERLDQLAELFDSTT